jgi:hypothetical protein
MKPESTETKMDYRRHGDQRIFITIQEAAALSPNQLGREGIRLLEQLIEAIFGGRSS